MVLRLDLSLPSGRPNGPIAPRNDESPWLWPSQWLFEDEKPPIGSNSTGTFAAGEAYLKAITAKSLLFCGQLRLRQIALFDSK